MKITWQQRMIEMAEINEISCEVGRRRWNWLAHVLRRAGERLFYSIGVDSRRTKSERETKDHLEKNCREREKQARMDELECCQGNDAGQRVLV